MPAATVVVSVARLRTLALDADGRVDAEPTGALLGEHAVGVGFVEQAVASEVGGS